ncbi:MAG: hypothetical protein ACE5FG_15275 [Myxococcota bacterium]
MPSLRYRISRLGAALAAATLIISSSAPARACSVCQPGDPLFSASDVSAQRQGSFSLYLETQSLSKKSGALPHEDNAEGHEHAEGGEALGEEPSGRDSERSYTRETFLLASWSPTDRLTLSARVPYRWITLEEDPAGGRRSSHRNAGFADLSLHTTAVLWRDRSALPTAWVEGRLMLKLPTAKNGERVDGEFDPHLQLGTGSLDWGLGLAATRRFMSGSLYASLFYRFNGDGARDYEYGDVLLINLAFTSDAFSLGRVPGVSGLRGGAELNFRYAGSDSFHGSRYRHSGGALLYATPFLELQLGGDRLQRAPWLRLSARLPVATGGLHGRQSERGVYTAGLRFAF